MSRCECGAIGDYKIISRLQVAVPVVSVEVFGYMILCFGCACKWFVEYNDYADRVQLIPMRKFWNYCGLSDVN